MYGHQEDIGCTNPVADGVDPVHPVPQGDIIGLRHNQGCINTCRDKSLQDQICNLPVPKVFPEETIWRSLARCVNAMSRINENLHP